ncbi:MAG: hypothetical protein LAP21_20080 [Acidobacteriia bacterium]|nr:hypothetical protein [Terriglobia bacterium]
MSSYSALNVVYALVIPFACGVGIQRLLSILDALSTWANAKPATRTGIGALISFVFGLLVAWLGGVHVLQDIAKATKLCGSYPVYPVYVDVIVTALIVSAGTEGFNSIIKFVGYAKEQQKAGTADKTNTVKTANPAALTALHS